MRVSSINKTNEVLWGEAVKPLQDHLFGSHRFRSIGKANALMGSAIDRDVTPRISSRMRRRGPSEILIGPFEERGRPRSTIQVREDSRRPGEGLSLNEPDGFVSPLSHEPEAVTADPANGRGHVRFAPTLDKIFPIGQQKNTRNLTRKSARWITTAGGGHLDRRQR